MKIGILSQWYDPEPGGAAIPGALARELARRGHDVHVLTGFPNYPTGFIYPGYHQRPWVNVVDDNGVKIRRVPLFPSHNDSSLERLTNYTSFALSSATIGLSALKGLDAVWVYNSPASIALPMWAARYLLGVPHVLHIMDLWPDSVESGGFSRFTRGPLVSRCLNWWCSAMYRSASSVAYTSPSVRGLLNRRGVPHEKLAYAPVWADPNVRVGATSTNLAPWKSHGNELVVLYAGAMGMAQGLTALLRALAQSHRRSDVVLLMAGSGIATDDLKAEAQTLGLKNVHFLGQMPRSTLSGIMNAADLHVISLSPSPIADISLPSKFHTTLSLGKPILAIVSGDAADLAEDSGAGLVARPGDVESIRAALDEAIALGPLGLRNLGQNGSQYYKQTFTLHIGVDRIEDLLHQASKR